MPDGCAGKERRMMISTEQFAALGVLFILLIVAFMVICLLVILKEIVKEKVDWWRRKWHTEIRLDELERRVDSIEEANGLRGEGES